MTPLVVDVKAAAASLGVSVWAVRHWVDDGLLPTVKLPSVKRPGEHSRRVLIAVKDLEEFVNRHRERPEGSPDAPAR